jgi:plastocyanin
MTIQRTLAALAAATALAALPVAAAAQHHGGSGDSHQGGDHGQAACDQAASAGAGHAACEGHGQGATTHAVAGAAPAAAAPRAARPRGAQVVAIEVTGQGFAPARATVKAGRPVTLVVTRKTERTCATDIVVKDYGVNQPLPLGQAVEVTFTPKKAGPVRYACGMDMIAGVLNVE